MKKYNLATLVAFSFIASATPSFASDDMGLPAAVSGEIASSCRFGQKVLPFLDGEHGGYELNLDALPAILQSALPETEALKGFQDATHRALRSYPSEDEKSKRLFQKIKNTFHTHRVERDPRIDKTTVLAEVPTFFTDGSYKGLEHEALYERLLEICTSNTLMTSKKPVFEEEISKFKETVDSIPTATAHIQEALGPYKVATLKNFLNKQILGLTGLLQLGGAEELFQMLKATGVIRTSIPTTVGYTYSQQLATREFLSNHPEVHTLILGCGSFAGNTALMLIEGPDGGEGGCGSCSKMHHIKKGEMTVSLMDNLFFDKTDYYNEEGSASDVMADATSTAFWEGVLEGLVGRKLSRTEDHSMAQLIDASNVGYLRSVLSDDGEFRVWIQGLVPSEFDINKTLPYTALGLAFKGLEDEYMVFGKGVQ